MVKFLPVFIVSLVLAALAQRYSVYDGRAECYRRKNKVFFVLVAIVMSLFVGLRTRYNDTGAYRHGYEMIDPTSALMDGIEWIKLGDNPGFNFVNHILHMLGFSTQSFLMFYAVITIVIYIWFVRKYTTNIWLSVFLLFTMGVYGFALAAVKQCVAIAFALIATDRAIQKKWIPFVLWVIVAMLFHPYAILFFFIPLLMFRPWGFRTYGMLLIAGLIGISLEMLLGTLIDITTMLGDEYDVSSFSGEGVNVFRLAVIWAPVVLSFVCQKQLKQEDDRVGNLMVNLTMLNAAIMFIARFGTANYFARLANYFLIFQVLAVPLLLRYFIKQSRDVLTAVIVVCYLAYFVYGNVVMYGGFDAGYDAIHLSEYLKQVF